MIGHSIGEYVAATLAGVFSLPDALRLVAARGRLMQSLPAGAMLAVTLDESEVAAGCPTGSSVATVNGPGTCVVAGETAAGRRVRRQPGGRARSQAAAHLARLPLADDGADPGGVHRADGGGAAAPRRRMPFLSNVTGTWITAEQATDPAYWAAHLRQPVRFGACVATLLADGHLGAGRVRAGPAAGRPGPDAGRQGTAPAQRALTPLASLPGPGEPSRRPGHPARQRRRAVVRGRAGARSDADPAGRGRVPLPTYPFERRRYWVDPDPAAAGRRGAGRDRPAAAAGVVRGAGVAAGRRRPARPVPLGRCLVFADGPRGDALVAALRAAGADPVEVRAGDGLRAPTARLTGCAPASARTTTRWSPRGRDGLPTRIVHAFAAGRRAGRHRRRPPPGRPRSAASSARCTWCRRSPAPG